MAKTNEIVVSPKNELIPQDVKKFWVNLLKFTAPIVAIFFAQLQMGTSREAAALVALYAFYGMLADLFSKWSGTSLYVQPKTSSK